LAASLFSQTMYKRKRQECTAEEKLEFNFKPTDGWLKVRNDFTFHKIYGEAQDADFDAAKTWKDDVLQSLLADYDCTRLLQHARSRSHE